MKAMKTLLATGIAAATFAVPAMAELSASAAVSSQYLFRGVDQGGGGAVSGDITYSNSGFYGSIWASSLGGSLGPAEVDFIAGWNGEFGGLGIDIGALNYYYPGDNTTGTDTFGAFSEAYLGLSFAGAEFYYYDNVAGATGAVYYSLGYSMGQFSILAGMADNDEPQGQTWDDDYVHVDLTYAFNDNLSFTVSKIVDLDDEINSNVTSVTGGSTVYDDDTQFVVSYSLPIK